MHASLMHDSCFELFQSAHFDLILPFAINVI